MIAVLSHFDCSPLHLRVASLAVLPDSLQVRAWHGVHGRTDARRVEMYLHCREYEATLSAYTYCSKQGSVPVTCETPRKRRKNKRAFAPITRYRDTTKIRDSTLMLPGSTTTHENQIYEATHNHLESEYIYEQFISSFIEK